MNASKTKDSIDFVPQDNPSCIVGVDEPFRKLKESILASHAKTRLVTLACRENIANADAT